MKKSIFLTLACFLAISLSAQMKLLKGTVKETSGEALVGANIAVARTTIGTMTDADGAFSIQVPANTKSVEVSYLGFASKTVNIENKSEINVVLESTDNTLNETVIVGYGTQKKVNLTGSVASVSSEDIMKRNAPNLSSAIQGLLPGVNVIQSTGRPGSDGGAIIVRGKGSLSSSITPLILIDGVEGDMNGLDMSIVESVSVLKDASASAIYGSRAANGVILITTKRAGENKLRITYNGYAGINKPTELPKPVSGADFMMYQNIANMNRSGQIIYDPERIEDLRRYGPDNWSVFDTNWRKEVMKNSSLVHKHSLSLSGSSGFLSYTASASYQYQDGLIDNNNFSRKTLRLNTDSKITNWLKFSLDINYRENQTKEPSIPYGGPDELIVAALTYSPVFAGVNRDGTYGDGMNGYNPIAITQIGGVKNIYTPEIGIKGVLTANPFKGFESLVLLSRRKVEDKIDTFKKAYYTYDKGKHKYTYPDNTTKDEYWSQFYQTQFTLQSSYENTINKHYFKVMGGVQTDEYERRDFSASKQGFPYDGFEELSTGSKIVGASGSRRTKAMLSYFGRINYSFSDRYLLEMTGRYDGSSRFSKANRWGFFPAASLGWRVSEESFFEPLKNKIDNLKLRVSYGKLGNQELPDFYPTMSLFYFGKYYYFDGKETQGAAISKMAHENITWEKSATTNVGLDMGILRNRFNLTFDVFRRNITDVLLQPSIPKYVGYDAAFENLTDMKSVGWELSLSWKDKIENVNYSITGMLWDANATYTQTSGLLIDGVLQAEKGTRVGAMSGFITEGFYQSQEDILNSPTYYNEKELVKPGDVKYKDISGPDGVPDGRITEADMTIIGDSQARYEYSLNLAAQWNNFDISVFLQGIGKKHVFIEGSGARPFYNGRSMYEHQTDFWTEDNPNAKFPRLLMVSSGESNWNYFKSDLWIRSAAYMRIKNVVIGYTLPKKITTKLGIANARIYANGQNLFTKHNSYQGYDPENSFTSSGLYYPVMQTYTFGIDINF
ncbi:MAG: SusC/RagA family TonB-linked outer membrane protein [Dysgonomonas sp.]